MRICEILKVIRSCIMNENWIPITQNRRRKDFTLQIFGKFWTTITQETKSEE